MGTYSPALIAYMFQVDMATINHITGIEHTISDQQMNLKEFADWTEKYRVPNVSV